MNKPTTCKRCGEKSLIEIEKEVENVEMTNFVTVKGYQCTICECFHYELDNYEIYEFSGREFIDRSKEVAGKYMTDYDRALYEKEKEYESI